MDRTLTLKAERCVQPCLVQLAELKALTEVFKLAEGEVLNIYTDSSYAHEVYLFAAIWKQRGFKRTDRSPVQHSAQIQI